MGRMMTRERLLWDHNTYYHALILRRLPPRCRNALEVGCGKGVFAAKLAERAEHVDALDRSAKMIEVARRRLPANAQAWQADLLTTELPADHYDVITSITALHHLPLEEALERLAGALRPGGTLVAIALPRRELVREWPVEVVAWVGQRVMVLALLGARCLPGRRNLLAKDGEGPAMPMVLDPELTVRQVRQRAATVLPGVRVRRLLYWRYLLVWQKPPAGGQAVRRARGRAAAALGGSPFRRPH